MLSLTGTSINFVKWYKVCCAASLTFICLSIYVATFQGLNYGMDFRGGLVVEVKSERSVSELRTLVGNKISGDFSLQEFGAKNIFLIRAIVHF